MALFQIGLQNPITWDIIFSFGYLLKVSKSLLDDGLASCLQVLGLMQMYVRCAVNEQQQGSH